MKFWLSNEEETRRAGAALAAGLLPLASSTPVVVFVRGNLGAGKSTFVRGFLSHVGVTGVMPSPTYSLVEPYQTDGLNVFHMDAYRIADGAELDYLGLDDIEQSGSILLVEWPDHVRDELPAPTATVDLEMSLHPDRHSSAKTLGLGQAQDQAQDRHSSAKPLVRAEGGVAVDRRGAHASEACRGSRPRPPRERAWQ